MLNGVVVCACVILGTLFPHSAAQSTILPSFLSFLFQYRPHVTEARNPLSICTRPAPAKFGQGSRFANDADAFKYSHPYVQGPRTDSF